MTSSAAPFIEFRNIFKKFGDHHANRDICLSIGRGEIHAIAGENGAGKTTLMNVLFGRVRPDSGTVLFQGSPLSLKSPRDAISAGIGMVHQKLLFFPQLSVLENIIVGHERSGAGVLRQSEARKEFFRLREAFGFELDPDMQAGELSFAARQQLELLRILYRGSETVILDEPTSFLGPQEVANLLELLRSLRAGGRTILFISHRLSEVFAIADRITVLRQGSVVATLDAEKTDEEEVARLMVGADVVKNTVGTGEGGKSSIRRRLSGNAEGRLESLPHMSLLEIRDLCVRPTGAEPRIENVSFSVMSDEIFGIAGIVGNGQRSLARGLSGRLRAQGGAILFDGSDISAMTVEERLRAGIYLVPENPPDEALLPEAPLWENFLLGRQREGEFQGYGFIRKHEVVQFTQDQIRENGIAARSAFEPLSSLSGGNVQKAALARVLCRRPRLAILEQPTHGLDLHAAARMRDRICALSSEGTAFIVLSYDLDELIALCDRIAVLFRGKLIGTVERNSASREVLGRWMVGLP